MGDQQRWFKLWESALYDDHLQSLPPELRWAWAAFGAYTKVHGTKGTVFITPTNRALESAMGLPVGALISTIKVLPHMSFEEGKKRHGELCVTWHNWTKYQRDSTQAERQRASRSKKRGEEKRSVLRTPAPQNGAGRATSKPPPDPETKAMVVAFAEAFKERFAHEAEMQWPRDMTIAKRLLAHHSAEDVHWLVREYVFNTPDHFDRQNAFTMPAMAACANQLFARRAKERL